MIIIIIMIIGYVVPWAVAIVAPRSSGVNRGQYLRRVVSGTTSRRERGQQKTRVKRTPHNPGYSSKGGAVGGGVQRMGVVLYNDTVYNTM